MKLRFVLELDARLSDLLRVAEQAGPVHHVAAFFAHSGDSWFWGAGLGLLWWHGNAFWKQWAIVIFAGMAFLAVLVMALKFSIRRRRPQGEWGAIYRRTDPHSFPSGHAARAFLIAVVAAGLGPAWLAWVLWVWAPIVALARVALGVHYASDIAAGALIGILAGLIVLQSYPFLLARLPF